MKELKQTSRFKKDLKRIQNNTRRIENVKRVLKLLQDEIPLPPQYRIHLQGTMKDVGNATLKMTICLFG